MNWRGRVAILGLGTLAIFLLAGILREAEKRREAEGRRDAAIEALSSTQDQIVAKLAEILVNAAKAAEAAGASPQAAVERIVEKVKGIDQELIDRAVEKATREVRGPPGPPGPAGPSGPPGAAAATTTTTTSTARDGTTTTTRPPAATTSTSTSTTTTTRPCLVNLLGIRVGC